VSYRLAVLIQGDSLSFFLARQGQPMHYILSITYRPAFQGMGLFGLVNFSNTNASLTTVVYSNLAIYPLS
jgi:hypothetical protein